MDRVTDAWIEVDFIEVVSRTKALIPGSDDSAFLFSDFYGYVHPTLFLSGRRCPDTMSEAHVACI